MNAHNPTAEKAQYRPGTVVHYIPDQSRFEPRWCREGMAIADDRGHLIDTFWISGSEAHVLNAAEIATVEALFHLDDYDELDRWRPDVRLWETYAPEDRQRITSQHGLQQRLFIRKGAQPDLATKIANAERKVAVAEAKVKSAQWDLDWARRELSELVASPASTGGGHDE